VSLPTTFTLRPAAASDAPAIRQLVRLGQINPTGLDWRRFVLAVTEAGQVIGCCQVKPHRDGAHELASLAVAPAWRGRGVARALIDHLLAAHPGELYLMCRSGLAEMYGKFGFQALATTEMSPYFRRLSRIFHTARAVLAFGEDLVVMKRVGAPAAAPDS
jgi:N-acetylglutamate synthase-like GNAT family acetyltransferase